MTIDPHPSTRRDFLCQSAVAAFSLGLVTAKAGAVGMPFVGTQANLSINTRNSAMALSPQEIFDRIEIQDLLVRYCYAVDDRDWDAYRAVFTPDAILDDTITGGVRSGVEEHVTYMKRALSKIRISQHAISTVLVDIDGDEAGVRAHCSCPMVVELDDGSTQVFFQGLWYRNRLVRTADGWRINELVEEGYWNHNVPAGFRF